MTDDKYIPYQPLNRLGFDHHPTKKIAYSNTITSAEETDLNDVWELCKFHRYDLPFKDSVHHLMRNPRNVSALSLLHISEVQPSSPEEDVQEGKVIYEEVAGFVCICPNDSPSVRTNLISVDIRGLVHNLSLGEEHVAALIYEALCQYCQAKTNTALPASTKLEVSIWLPPTEVTFFRTVYVYINALFGDAYLPERMADVSYTTTATKRIKEETARNAVANKKNKNYWRSNLNNPEYWKFAGDKHVLTFPRLPGITQ